MRNPYDGHDGHVGDTPSNPRNGLSTPHSSHKRDMNASTMSADAWEEYLTDHLALKTFLDDLSETFLDRDLDCTKTLLNQSSQLQTELMHHAESSEEIMLPCPHIPLPTGAERDSCLAIDIGGSTMRLALVKLLGRPPSFTAPLHTAFDVQQHLSRDWSPEEKKLPASEFFDLIVTFISNALDSWASFNIEIHRPLQIGMTWSFPLLQTDFHSGKLLAVGKGFSGLHDVVGQDVVQLFNEAFGRQQLPAQVLAVVNDTVATLLARVYVDPNSHLALIAGTGVNAAAILPVSIFPDWKCKSDIRRAEVVVNTELSLMENPIFPRTQYDAFLNANHERPYFQSFEYMVAGMYLGELARLVLLKAVNGGAILGKDIGKSTGGLIYTPYALKSDDVSDLRNDVTVTRATKSKIVRDLFALKTEPTAGDIAAIQSMCKIISGRAARCIAVALHALWQVRQTNLSKSARRERRPATVACNGGLIERHFCFFETVQKYLDDMTESSTGDSRSLIVLEKSGASCVRGAAVACAMARHTVSSGLT